VLLKELQSLALDVKVLDEEGNEIEVKELDDEVQETGKGIRPTDLDSNHAGDFIEGRRRIDKEIQEPFSEEEDEESR
jgi:DNA-directed RNA polymerase subunit beta